MPFMKIRKYLFIILSFPFIGVSQTNHYNDTIYYDKDWKNCEKEERNYYRTFSKSSIKYLDDFLIQVTDHYKNGKIQKTGYVHSFNSDERIGLYTFYRKNGTVKVKELYEFNETIDNFNEIKEYSSLVKQCDSLGKFFHVSFFSKGHINEAGFISDCNNICEWIRYNPFGKKIYYTTEYRNNGWDGTKRTYHSNGKLWKEKHFKDDMKTGTWKYFNFRGILEKIEIYEKDILIDKKKIIY